MREPRWGRITVVERERAVVNRHRQGHLAPFSRYGLDDPRAEVVQPDLLTYVHTSGPAYDALCLDIDNGPQWTVTEGNTGLYATAGLAACRARLTPGGALAVWSAQPSAAFEDSLRAAGFEQVRAIEIPVRRGVPDVVHLAIKAA